MNPRRLPLAVALDLIAVMAFVVLGRRTHDEGNSFVQIAETAAPFLVGLGVGWLVARAWRRPDRVLTGVAIWPITVLVGMALRRWGFADGTATSFIVVTALFLGAAFVGWRVVATVVDRNRTVAVTQ